MNVSAYTLVRVQPHRIVDVVKAVKKFQVVTEVISVYGEYDLILKTTTETLDELSLFIYNDLRFIPGITKTTTMIISNLGKKSD